MDEAQLLRSAHLGEQHRRGPHRVGGVHDDGVVRARCRVLGATHTRLVSCAGAAGSLSVHTRASTNFRPSQMFKRTRGSCSRRREGHVNARCAIQPVLNSTGQTRPVRTEKPTATSGKYLRDTYVMRRAVLSAAALARTQLLQPHLGHHAVDFGAVHTLDARVASDFPDHTAVTAAHLRAAAVRGGALAAAAASGEPRADAQRARAAAGPSVSKGAGAPSSPGMSEGATCHS